MVGVVRHTDKGAFMGDNNKNTRVWQGRDLYGKVALNDDVLMMLTVHVL